MNKYQCWIDDNVGPHDTLGMCAAWVRRMGEAFPKLTQVRGHYLCHTWGPREHWWLTTPDGKIVDPTAGQIPLSWPRRIRATGGGHPGANRQVPRVR